MTRSTEASAADLIPFGDDIYLCSDPVRIVGMKLSATMTVVRLPARQLLVYSPIGLTAQRRAAIESLGTVSHLYAPNTFHHRWIGEWAWAFPNARIHAPRPLQKKRSDLNVYRLCGEHSLGELANAFEEVTIDGFALHESVLLHRPSGTLLVADLVHNIGKPTGFWTRAYSSAMGFYDRVALSKMIRWTAFTDAAKARESLDTLMSLDFDRLVVGHGSPIDGGARQVLAEAYDWLRPKRALLAPRHKVPSRGLCG